MFAFTSTFTRCELAFTLHNFRCSFTLIKGFKLDLTLVFRREPYSVTYGNIVQIRFIKFKLVLISWTKS